MIVFREDQIDSLFRGVTSSVGPGAAVGIGLRGQPVYRKGFGLASIELPLGLTAAQQLPIASISKHFTSLLCLILCSEGGVSIDDNLGRWIPELPSHSQSVTLRQLMGHTSGLHDVFELSWLFDGHGQRVSRDQLFQLYQQIETRIDEPGRMWRYNNGGYALLAIVAERLGQASLEALLQKYLFEPHGLWDTSLPHIDSDFIPNRAARHCAAAENSFTKPLPELESGGVGGLLSTVADMLRWLSNLSKPSSTEAATLRELASPLVLNNGFSTGYGLGLMTGAYRGHQAIWHSGAIHGATAQILTLSELQLDVVVLANRDDISAADLAWRVVDECLGVNPSASQKSTVNCMCLPSAGLFRSPASGRVVRVEMRHEKWIATIDGVDMDFVAGSDGILRPAPRVRHLKIEISAIAASRPIALRLSEFGQVDELIAIPPSPSSRTEALRGEYRAVGMPLTATIADVSGQMQLHTSGIVGRTNYALEAFVDNVWRIVGPGGGIGLLTFDEASGCVGLTTPRTALQLAPL